MSDYPWGLVLVPAFLVVFIIGGLTGTGIYALLRWLL